MGRASFPQHVINVLSLHLHAAVADLAQTAADGAVGQRHLQQAAATGSGASMMAALSELQPG